MKISIFKNAVSAKDFVCSATKGTKALVGNPRVAMVFTLLFVFTLGMFAQNTAGDYSAGTTALGTVTTEIAKYVPVEDYDDRGRMYLPCGSCPGIAIVLWCNQLIVINKLWQMRVKSNILTIQYSRDSKSPLNLWV